MNNSEFTCSKNEHFSTNSITSIPRSNLILVFQVLYQYTHAVTGLSGVEVLRC